MKTRFLALENCGTKKKQSHRQATPITENSTSAFQPVALGSTVIEGIQSIAERNPSQESFFLVGAITPHIATVVQTYTTANISARTLTALEAEMRSDSASA